MPGHPHGFYLIAGVGEAEVRAAAQRVVAAGEVAVIHRHGYDGKRCLPTCETLRPPAPALPRGARDVGHSIVVSDGNGWDDPTPTTTTVPG